MHDRDGTATDIRAICQSTGALAPYALFARLTGRGCKSLPVKGKSALFTELSTGNGDKRHLPEKAERTNGKRPFARISRDLPSYCTLPASSSS